MLSFWVRFGELVLALGVAVWGVAVLRLGSGFMRLWALLCCLSVEGLGVRVEGIFSEDTAGVLQVDFFRLPMEIYRLRV